MHYFIFPDIDTTVYSRTGSKNTGLDQILEIRKDQNKIRVGLRQTQPDPFDWFKDKKINS